MKMQQGFLRYYEDGFIKLIPDRLCQKYFICMVVPETNSINIRYDLGGSCFVVTDKFPDQKAMFAAFRYDYNLEFVIGRVAEEMRHSQGMLH
jgi:hypothetical protein